jgi:hypothetical protein
VDVLDPGRRPARLGAGVPVNETISFGGRPVALGFGLGGIQTGKYHSWSEVSDLVNAYSYTVNQINAAIGIGCGDVARRATPVVPPGEPDFAQKYPALLAWLDDYNNAYAQFMYMRDAVMVALKGAWGSTFEVASATSDDPAFADYGGNVFDALAAKYEPFVALDQRLRQIAAAGGGFPAKCLPTYPNMPQPKAADYSLDAYKALDAVVQGAKKAAKDFGEGVKDFLSSPPVLFFGAVALVVGGAVIVSRVAPKPKAA